MRILWVLAVACFISGCGGGGGGSSPPGQVPAPIPSEPPPPVQDVSANGNWRASVIEDGIDYTYGIILQDGALLGLITALEGIVFLEGSYTVTGTEISGSYRMGTAETGTFSGTVVEGESISLTLNSGGETSSLRVNLHPDYNRPSSLSLVQGTWVQVLAGESVSTVTVSADGAFFGQDIFGCVITGAVTIINAAHNLYDLLYSVASCAESNGEYTGYGILSDAPTGGSNNIFVVLTHSLGTNWGLSQYESTGGTPGTGGGGMVDGDDDNDGVSNANDAFPQDPGESTDTDGDGTGDNSDTDDDNDGVADTDDPCPLDGADTCDDTTSVVSLEISGTMPLTSIGQKIQLAATTHMLNGSSQAIASAFVHWVSSDPAVATVIDGTVTAVGPGNASAVATYQGQKAVVEVSVHISVRETGTVRVLYAAPSDREFRSDYRDAIQHGIVDLQSWYRRQTGGLTFSLYDATPEQCELSETSDYYDQDPWQKVLEGVQHCAPVEDNTSTFAWVIYADLAAACDARGSLGRGGPGLTMVGRDDLEGLIGNRLVYNDECGNGPYVDPVTRWTGGIGHELGHALGLPHPPGCEDGLPTCDYDALMHLGFETYPNTYLRPDDKQVLWRSPFIEKNPAQRQLMEEAGIVAAIRGTVSDSGGEVVEGIRVSAVSDAFWGWGETASDGTFEVRLPDGSSGSSVLSVHAGGVADCGWLGYHVAGGLTMFRERATRIELGEDDPASIEISLPAISGELCQGQRTVSGTVLGPSGDPVGVFVGAFDQWSFSGDNGLFELRLPEGSGGSSPLLVEVPGCSNVGFYGPGGFTTRPADAWQWELGGVNEAGIVIRLPATPEELCRRQPTIAGTVVGPDGEVMEGIGVVALPSSRWGTSEADGTFEIRLLEGTTGMPVLGIHADCGQVGYYGPNGFTTSREDATEIEIGEGNVTGIVIRLPAEPDELCGQ